MRTGRAWLMGVGCALVLRAAAAAPGPPPDPRKGERRDGRTAGRIRGSDVALAVPRVLLTPPRLVVAFVGQLARAVLQLDHKHHLAAKLATLLTSEDGLIGVHPILRYNTGFSPVGGFTFFDNRSMGRGSHLQLSLAAGLPQLIESDVTIEPPLPPPYRVSISGHYLRRNDLLYTGVAQSSTGRFAPNDDPRGRYGVDAVDVPVQLTVRPHRKVAVAVDETWAFRRYHDGRTDLDDGSVGQVFCAEVLGRCLAPDVDAARVPGFYAGANYFATDASVIFDSRDSEGVPTHGVRLYFAGRYAHGVSDGSSWLHFRSAVTGAIRLGRDTRVLLLRISAELLEPLQGSTVPFTELVTLGGADSLRGFPLNRFRDYSSVLVTAEYRYAVWLGADATIFADWGGVFGQRFDGFRPDRMIPDVGVGLRIRTARSFLMRLQLAYGYGEGVQFLFSTTTGL